MIKAKCIKKFRNSRNIITDYRLQDAQGNIGDFTSQQLKIAIKNKQITVVNLKLTSDERLIDARPNQPEVHGDNVANAELAKIVYAVLHKLSERKEVRTCKGCIERVVDIKPFKTGEWHTFMNWYYEKDEETIKFAGAKPLFEVLLFLEGPNTEIDWEYYFFAYNSKIHTAQFKSVDGCTVYFGLIPFSLDINEGTVEKLIKFIYDSTSKLK